jgi:outer membrane protein TolC
MRSRTETFFLVKLEASMSRPFGRTVLCDGRLTHCVRYFAKLTIPAFLLLSASAHAQEPDVLTLSQAVALATDDQPQLAALASQEQAAREAAHAEGELPDPKLAFGVENLPVTGDDAFDVGREDMTMITLGLMQDVVTREKRQAASARMSAEAARISAERMLNARTIQREAALAWIDAFEAQRRAATLHQFIAEITAEREVSTAQIASGTSRPTDVLTLDIELSSTRDELILAERDEARARAGLARWIGDAALRPLPDAPPHELSAKLDLAAAEQAIDSHPALQSSSHAIEAAQRAVDRARAERRPDWGWQLMYGQRQDDRSDMISFQVTVGLPWNRADRQDRRIAEKLADASAMRSDLSDRRRMLDAELTAIRAEITASAERLREHEQHRVPNARARLETSQGAYAGGNGALLDVWRARRAWIESSLHHDMILADRARALAKLAWLTGRTEVLP